MSPSSVLAAGWARHGGGTPFAVPQVQGLIEIPDIPVSEPTARHLHADVDDRALSLLDTLPASRGPGLGTVPVPLPAVPVQDFLPFQSRDAIGDDMAAETARAKVAAAGRTMARYKAAIDAGGDLEEISTWISDAKAQRLAAEAGLRRAATRSRMTRQQIADLISEVSDLAATLRGAESDAAAEAYRQPYCWSRRSVWVGTVREMPPIRPA